MSSSDDIAYTEVIQKQRVLRSKYHSSSDENVRYKTRSVSSDEAARKRGEQRSAARRPRISEERQRRRRVVVSSDSDCASSPERLQRRKSRESRTGTSSGEGSPRKPRETKGRHVRSASFVFDHPIVHHARTSSYAVYQQSVDIARNTISEIDLPASSWCGFFASAMLAVTLGEVVKVNNAQPTPYMDEVFHVRQAQHFCDGNWTIWDDKITTFPGLYILTAAVATVASAVTSKPKMHWCTLEKLRFVNIVMSVFIFLVMYTLFRKLSRRLKDEPGLGIQPIHRTCCMMNSLVLCCFPLLYFYNLLYYTDVGSVLFVLASYSCSIRNHHFKSAMLGAVSVMFRQTNIIWVGFTAGTAVIRDIENRGIFHNMDDFLSQTEIAIKVIIRHLRHYLYLMWPYLLVILGFGVFVVYNGSITVGDKAAHKFVLHFPQFLYFLLFLTAFSLPHMLQRLRYSHLTVLNYVFKPVHVLLFFVSAVLSLYFFKYEHPYLLADNRHYTFYIWRKILNRTPTMMYMLLPVVFYTYLNMVALLSTVHSKFFVLLYFVCCAAQMVPVGLLEFRYYILPYLLYRLHVPQHSWIVLFLELCQYTLINLITVKIFLNKTFDWETADELSPNPQRFMW